MTRKKKAYHLYLQSEHWQKLRAFILERDKGLCVRCGQPACQVHHKVYRKRFEDSLPHDLMSVCRSCHEAIHAIVKSDTGKVSQFKPVRPTIRQRKKAKVKALKDMKKRERKYFIAKKIRRELERENYRRLRRDWSF